MPGELINTGMPYTSLQRRPAALTNGLERLRRIVEAWATEIEAAGRRA